MPGCEQQQLVGGFLKRLLTEAEDVQGQIFESRKSKTSSDGRWCKASAYLLPSFISAVTERKSCSEAPGVQIFCPSVCGTVGRLIPA